MARKSSSTASGSRLVSPTTRPGNRPPGSSGSGAHACWRPARSRPAARCSAEGAPSRTGAPTAIRTAPVRSPPRGSASRPSAVSRAGQQPAPRRIVGEHQYPRRYGDPLALRPGQGHQPGRHQQGRWTTHDAAAHRPGIVPDDQFGGDPGPFVDQGKQRTRVPYGQSRRGGRAATDHADQDRHHHPAVATHGRAGSPGETEQVQGRHPGETCRDGGKQQRPSGIEMQPRQRGEPGRHRQPRRAEVGCSPTGHDSGGSGRHGDRGGRRLHTVTRSLSCSYRASPIPVT